MLGAHSCRDVGGGGGGAHLYGDWGGPIKTPWMGGGGSPLPVRAYCQVRMTTHRLMKLPPIFPPEIKPLGLPDPSLQQLLRVAAATGSGLSWVLN